MEGGSEGATTGYDWLARDVDRYMYEHLDTLVISAAGDQSGIVSPGLAKVNTFSELQTLNLTHTICLMLCRMG